MNNIKDIANIPEATGSFSLEASRTLFTTIIRDIQRKGFFSSLKTIVL